LFNEPSRACIHDLERRPLKQEGSLAHPVNGYTAVRSTTIDISSKLEIANVQ
jgi:hypothetical protein